MADVSITGPVTVDSLAFCETMIAQVAIAAGKVVYRDASNSGKANLADADAEASAQAIGIAVTTAGIGEPVVVAKNGATITQAGTTFTRGLVNYVSVTAGGMAPVAEVSTGDYVTSLGVATSTSSFKINITVSGVTVA
jgi:hypothetical protein